MQPSDIAGLVSVDSPTVSPDGRRIAFVVTRVDLDANRYRSAVWLADADGASTPYPLTTGEHGDGSPAWSPDGRRLAFTRSVDGTGSLHVTPMDGPGETITVCARPEAVEGPVWSPDGTRIAFASRVRAARYTDGDDDRARPPRRIDRLLNRLDGTGWTVDRPRGVFVTSADGSSAPVPVASGPYEHDEPVWSPDGTHLVVSAVRAPDGDLDQRADLYRLDPTGRAEPEPLTTGPRSYSRPAFSTDGTRIAMLVDDPLLVPTHTQVAVLDGGEQVVSASLDRQCAPFPGARAPLWQGDDLLFPIEDRGDVHVYRVPADGSRPPVRVLGGTRAVTAFDEAGGTFAFVASTPAERPELFVRDPDGTERRLTGLSAAFHDRVPVHPPEPFTAGDDVDAWIVRPAPTGERVPVLLSIHGGPMTQYPNAWNEEFQMWAAAGYAVVYANPHGSTGRTDAWAREIRSPEASREPGTGWAGTAAADVLAVLDAALARHPELDPDRVGVLGGSYGGYLTTWLVAHTDRFAAACSERAANNLESLEWDSDCSGLFHHEVGVTHVDAPDVYRAQSPVHRVRDITTPLLIVHSDDDLRCPPSQADQLFVALRMLGREVEYWRFPAEGHELSRSGSPRHRIQRAELILDWFGRHLGGRRSPVSWLG